MPEDPSKIVGKIRAFIAISAPSEIPEKIAAKIPFLDLRGKRLHLTLRFLGDLAKESLESLKA